MQSLGKVPNARRPPANLPSLKSEHSGSDAAVSLVPSGGPGWGKQDSTTSTSATTAPSSTPTNAVASTTPPTANATASSQPTTNNIAPPATANKQQASPQQHPQTSVTAPPPSSSCPPSMVSGAPPAVGSDKSWSAVMSGADILGQHPPPYQSPQFQHEFPSLSASGGDGLVPAGGVAQRDVQYGPGPSLRPQTEGSWMQGGSRSTPGAGADQPGAPPPGKGNSAQLAGPPQHLGPAGPAPPAGALPQHMLQQFRGVAPPFMFRGNFPPANGAVSDFSAMTNPLTGRGRFPAPGIGPAGPVSNGQFAEQRPGGGPPIVARNNINPQPPTESEEVTPRPIIKEEDLNRMDDMTRDVGWASHDDIDYK